MVFNIQTINESLNRNNDSIIKTNDNILSFENKSFFLETLDYISKENREFQSLLNKSLYGNNDLLNEGVLAGIALLALRKLKPKEIIFKILEGFVKILDKLWGEFKVLLLNLFSNNRVISFNKNKLSNINSPVKFSEDRYIYTNIGVSTSYTTFNNELNKQFSNLVLNLSKFHEYKSYEGLFGEIENIRNEINNSDDYFNEVRGNIVGQRTPIEQNSFSSELFNFFRNGGGMIPSGIISPQEIRNCADSYFNYRKTMASIEKDKSDLQKSAKKIQKDINSIKLEDYVRDTLPQEAQKMFIEVLQKKCLQIKSLTEIYSFVFSIKLDTVKEMYVQNTKILMAACRQIVREG